MALAPSSVVRTLTAKCLIGCGSIAALLSACNSAPLDPVSLQLTASTTRLLPGDTVTLVARRVEGGIAVVTPAAWTSVDPSIATVSAAGVVTAIQPGTTSIQAQADNHAASIHVIVDARLTVSEAALVLTADAFAGPLAYLVAVGAGAGGPPMGIAITRVDYGAGQPSGWLAASLTQATTPASLLLTTHSAGLLPGTYSAAVTVGANTPNAPVNSASTTVKLEVTGLVDVSAGPFHTCAHTLLGTTYCWGFGPAAGTGANDAQPVPAPFGGTLRFAALAGGGTSTCGLVANGNGTYCWTHVGSPAPLAGGIPFKAITAGARHVCGRDFSNVAFCWGDNEYGQLGNGTEGGVRTTVPSPVMGNLAFVTLSAAGRHTCGLTADGTAYCWGSNTYGELGDGTTINRATPARVAGIGKLTSISAGGGQSYESDADHTCGIATTGDAYCWGNDAFGQLGTGSLAGSQQLPAKVVGGYAFKQVVAGGSHTCALTTPGDVYCWGAEKYFFASSDTIIVTYLRPDPRLTKAGLGITSLSAGTGHTCGVAPPGTVYCWGVNGNGQLGDGSTAWQQAPKRILWP